MAKKNTQMDEEIIDLTELIEPGTSGSRAAAAYAKASTMPPADHKDDFGSILQETAGKSASHNVDPDESLDMSDMGGIDNLLESLDIPAQPRGKAPVSDPGPDPAELDNVLDDLLPGPERKPAASVKETEKPAEVDEFDLDALLEEEISEPPAAAKEAEPEKTSEMDADLDDILASFDEPAPVKSKPAPVPETEMAADLDDILGEIEAPAPPAHAVSEPAKAEESEPSPLEHEPEVPEPEASEPEASPEPAEEPAGAHIPESLDGFMDELDQELENQPESAGEKPAESAPEQEVQPETPPAPAFSHPALPAEMSARDGKHAAVTVQTWPEDMIAGLCQGIATAQNSGDRKAIQEFSRELGAQSAHVQDMGSQLAQLAKRILACESKVAASRARISGLEKGMEAAAALDDLLHAGTPLHTGFMSLISTAVGNALQGFQPPVNDEPVKALEALLSARIEKTEKRLDDLAKAVEAAAAPVKDMETRLGDLEARLQDSLARFENFESRVNGFMENFEATMEKTAAAAVAQVLQEEISHLMQE